MKEPQPFLPRGLLAGALLAALLLIPAFLVMIFDASAGKERPAASTAGQFLHQPKAAIGQFVSHSSTAGTSKP